ncbi:hypothetical protein PFICI_05381 [Pestalotiopsis fici W106-1]|uniref:DAPG hydrolase PhiG domain-containing protein n=1 Tax=Pestalotiopsis fici (strain W106-1 / CGMCC3.15140) TaxID=1229662 RepID=W3XBT3_PESFW|nr:uncharacterized protein PFICI_05381 [Pestalotiopsis fici W106-1]ETS83505.1 hypothetical protein PFICI_05381 [Pestalotiopsis fici W106-1]
MDPRILTLERFTLEPGYLVCENGCTNADMTVWWFRWYTVDSKHYALWSSYECVSVVSQMAHCMHRIDLADEEKWADTTHLANKFLGAD